MASLVVKEIFRSIQGEGPFSGYPAVFIRLSGCNLSCDFCDTDFQGGKNYYVDELVKKVQNIAEGTDLVVLTGGEPFAQNLTELTIRLVLKKFTIQVESNGSINPHNFEQWDYIYLVVSPKYAGVNPDVVSHAKALKFVLKDKEEPNSYLIEWAKNKGVAVYLSPCDEKDELKNKANMFWIRDMALRLNVRISLQIHKILEVV